MLNFCPHCGSDVNAKILDYYVDIVRKREPFQFKCPSCDQLIEVSVRISFELRKLPLPNRPCS